MDRSERRLVVLLLAVACGDEASTEPCTGEPRLVQESSDGTALFDTACSGDTDCPAGTVCSAPSPFGGMERCAIPARAEVRNQLTAGFNVAEMPFEPEIDELDAAAVFRWEAPAKTRWVHCVVFGCLPRWDGEALDSEDGPRTGAPITNYDRCALQSATLQAHQAYYIAGNVSPHGAEVEINEPACSPLHPTRVETITDLLVGCWAYDEIQVIAATPLRRLTLEQLGPLAPRLVRTSCPRLDGPRPVSCVGTSSTTPDEIGTCEGGLCRRRCVRGSDCRDRDTGKLCRAAFDAVAFGVCVEE